MNMSLSHWVTSSFKSLQIDNQTPLQFCNVLAQRNKIYTFLSGFFEFDFLKRLTFWQQRQIKEQRVWWCSHKLYRPFRMDHFGSVEDWLFRNKKHSTAKFLLKLLFSNKNLILRDHFGSVEDWLFRNKQPSTAKFL